MFPSFEIFKQVFAQCTENYECLLVDNKVQSNKLNDQVYWYKAEPNCNFKVCSSELWDMQEKDEENRAYGRSEEPDDDEDYDPMIINKKKNKNTPVIKVRKGFN
jgi:hypothetical protein